MKRCLEVLLNLVYRDDLELLYGKGSRIEITNINYCTNNKHYSIQCELFVSDLKLFEESNTEGVEFLISESWKFTGIHDEKIALTTSVSLL